MHGGLHGRHPSSGQLVNVPDVLPCHFGGFLVHSVPVIRVRYLAAGGHELPRRLVLWVHHDAGQIVELGLEGRGVVLFVSVEECCLVYDELSWVVGVGLCGHALVFLLNVVEVLLQSALRGGERQGVGHCREGYQVVGVFLAVESAQGGQHAVVFPREAQGVAAGRGYVVAHYLYLVRVGIARWEVFFGHGHGAVRRCHDGRAAVLSGSRHEVVQPRHEGVGVLLAQHAAEDGQALGVVIVAVGGQSGLVGVFVARAVGVRVGEQYGLLCVREVIRKAGVVFHHGQYLVRLGLVAAVGTVLIAFQGALLQTEQLGVAHGVLAVGKVV